MTNIYSVEICLQTAFSELEEELTKIVPTVHSGTNMQNGLRDIGFECDKAKSIELLNVLFNHPTLVDELVNLYITPLC